MYDRNQLLVINISLYIVSDLNARYARVSPISPPISDMKNSHPIRSWYPIFRTLLAWGDLARVEPYTSRCSIFAACPIGTYDIALSASQHLFVGLASKTHSLLHLWSSLVWNNQQNPHHVVPKQDSLVVMNGECITCKIKIDSHYGVENYLSSVSLFSLMHQKSLQNWGMTHTPWFDRNPLPQRSVG